MSAQALLVQPGARLAAEYMVCESGVGKQERQDEPAYASIDEAERTISGRIASDNLRYQKIYGLDYADPAHYDLVIDTTAMKGPEETAEAILSKMKERSFPDH